MTLGEIPARTRRHGFRQKELIVHLRIALSVFGRRQWWRCDQCGIDNGPLAHHRTILGEMSIDRVEYPLGQSNSLEQMPELRQRRRVGRRLTVNVDTDETLSRTRASRSLGARKARMPLLLSARKKWPPDRWPFVC